MASLNTNLCAGAALVCAFALTLTLGACSSGGGDASSSDSERPRDEEARPNAEDDPRPALVFLGDSLTAGMGLAASEAMPSLIQQRLDEVGVELRVINAGRSGDTSAAGLSRLSWYLRPEVNLEVLVVGLGSNDAMRGLPLEELEGNLLTIFAKTREARPDARIFLLAFETFPNLGRDYADAYREVFPRVAEATGATLLPFPLEGVAGVPALNQADGIHPTAEGTSRVAENVWRALAPHLGVTPPP
jgi:acyl-CoA thioesterase I